MMNPWRWSAAVRGRKGMVFFLLLLFPLLVGRALGRNDIITVPMILTDYYGWAYTEAFEDKSEIYAWSTAGVDALGWGIILARREYSGLFLVNVAGIAKTIYPAVQLLASSDPGVHERAWIALGTHAVTLISLELLGKPVLGIQAWEPRRGGFGAELACRF